MASKFTQRELDKLIQDAMNWQPVAQTTPVNGQATLQTLLAKAKGGANGQPGATPNPQFPARQ
jgi:hypothetical protein